MDMSLDEYIRQNDVESPFCKKESDYNSKFDRYNRDPDDDDDDDEMMDVNMEMPRLVPSKPTVKATKARIPVHERLGQRKDVACTDSDTDSIVIKVNQPNRRRRNDQLKRLNNGNFGGRSSVQHRLNKNFVNPGIVARNNIASNAINSFMESAMRTFGSDQTNIPGFGGNLLSALATRILNSTQIAPAPAPEQKYNMAVQKEISALQGRQLFYKCPGAIVVSSDGPGVNTPVKVPQNETGISLNQRFA